MSSEQTHAYCPECGGTSVYEDSHGRWCANENCRTPLNRSRRIRMDLGGGTHMDVTVTEDADQATMDALRAVGEATVEEIRKKHPTWGEDVA